MLQDRLAPVTLCSTIARQAVLRSQLRLGIPQDRLVVRTCKALGKEHAPKQSLHVERKAQVS
jgi:hypothetical protein